MIKPSITNNLGSAGAPGAAHSAAHKTPAKANASQAAKPAASAVSKNPPSAPQQTAARTLGLPADKLSASIISFARFFSLPLKPELLKHIRQQAFTMTPNALPSTEGTSEAETVLKSREALSLAACAAEGKGVELQPKSLETYAQALDPESRRGNGERRGKKDKNDDDHHDSKETSLRKTGVINTVNIEKMALEAAEKDPLLAILNRLPGKDGKRWIVLPFDFSDKGREFKVSLRILLETGKTVSRAACMALDIAIRETEEKRLLFVLEPANRLSVYLRPELSPSRQQGLVRELSALLEIAPERIYIKAQTESFPFEAECGNDLGSINEAV